MRTHIFLQGCPYRYSYKIFLGQLEIESYYPYELRDKTIYIRICDCNILIHNLVIKNSNNLLDYFEFLCLEYMKR